MGADAATRRLSAHPTSRGRFGDCQWRMAGNCAELPSFDSRTVRGPLMGTNPIQLPLRSQSLPFPAILEKMLTQADSQKPFLKDMAQAKTWTWTEWSKKYIVLEKTAPGLSCPKRHRRRRSGAGAERSGVSGLRCPGTASDKQATGPPGLAHEASSDALTWG